MIQPRTTILTCALVILLAGCATAKPVLYPNSHLKRTNSAMVERDIAECTQAARASGAGSKAGGKVAGRTVVGAGVGAATGAAVGAVTGNPARGAAAGAAGGGTSGFFSGLFSTSQPSPVYKRFVDKCLSDKGYEPIGWE